MLASLTALPRHGRRKRLRWALSNLLFKLGHTDLSNPAATLIALTDVRLQLVRAAFH